MVGVSPQDDSVSSIVKVNCVPCGTSFMLSNVAESADELRPLALDRNSASSVCTCSPSGSCDTTDVLSPISVRPLVVSVLGVSPLPVFGLGV